MKHLKIVLMALLCLVFCANLVIAQTVTLTDLPPNIPNTRHYTDHYMRFRPGLSIRGFDSEAMLDVPYERAVPPPGMSYGLGLKQILEAVYDGSSTDNNAKIIFEDLFEISKEDIEENITGSYKARLALVNKNTKIFQARAFIALVSYVFEIKLTNTEFNELDPKLPTATDARDALYATKFFMPTCNSASNPPPDACSDLRWWYPSAFEDYDIDTHDQVKWTHAAGAISRGLDFYLALENAMEYYEPGISDSDPRLLTASRKSDVFITYWDNTAIAIDTYLDTQVHEYLIDVQYDEIEPGNRPLKLHIAKGYATINMQTMVPKHYNNTRRYTHLHFGDARAATLQEALLDERKQYWGYQSGTNGRRFWAEGAFYLNFALVDVIPYLHAMRSNGLIYPGYPDPFRSGSIFIEPLHWLADQVTYEGFNLALDDGRMARINTSNMLRWSSEYGENDLGEKFAWINNKTGIAGHPMVQPVALAIPQNEGMGTEPARQVGIAQPDVAQILISRHKANSNEHMVAMNVEHGDAIVRGEGHEQGDPLQLLYLVNGESYLMDMGYEKEDGADPLKVSSWNNYKVHNVMTGWPSNPSSLNDGGVPAPETGFPSLKAHFVARQPHVDSTKTRFGVANNNASTSKVDVFEGKVRLWLRWAGFVREKDGKAEYHRKVLFIKDENNPYLIDFNLVYSDRNANFSSNNISYQMNYHVHNDAGSGIVIQQNDAGQNYYRFGGIDDPRIPSTGNNVLWIQPFLVEYANSMHRIESYSSSGERSEELAPNSPVSRLVLTTETPDGYGLLHEDHHSRVSFIRAMPNALAGDITTMENEMPIERSSYSTNARAWAWFSWQKNASTIDVFVARAGHIYRNELLREPISFQVPEADNKQIELDLNDDFGFVRLTKENGIWKVMPEFRVNAWTYLTVSKPTNLRFQASTGGGAGPGGGSHQNPVLVWDNSNTPELDHYQIDRCRTGTQTCVWAEIATTAPSVTTYTDNTVIIDQNESAEYLYRVKAVKSAYEHTFSSVFSNTIGINGAGLESIESDSTLTEEVAINEEATIALPTTFALERNFPNPFSQSTRIVYALPEPSTVKITVYDIMGRVVKVFNQENMAGGWHDVVWQPEDVGSGMYLYRIEAIGESGTVFTKTHKMVVVK